MQVLVDGRPLPPLRSRKSLWLLALLVLRDGRPAERDWLSGALWPDATQSRASMNLRVVLSELRHGLGSEGRRLISPARHTLSLDLAGAEVDVVAFDSAISAKSHEELAAAVALYRGPLLEGCAEEWIDQERGAREQDCLHALQTLADAGLAKGDFDEASSFFQRAVALDPWREGAQRGLMEALAGGGDSNAALHVYQAFVRLLRKDDPRASPDEQTTAVYTRLRAQARRRSAVSAAPLAPEETPLGVTGNLPSPLTDLIGREDERTDVLIVLRRSRLATLTGPGGIGKTRLAIAVAEEAAREFADGVFLVALDVLSDGSQIAAQIAGALGLREESSRSLMETLIAHLKSKRLLLILDNCEHLLEASAQMTTQLLAACAGLRILATSREGLGVTGEASWKVPGLPVPNPSGLPDGDVARVRVLESYASVRLFVERAQAARQTFTLMAGSALAVAQVCARLEGIPLALELAAACVRAMTVEQIAARLDNRLSLLTGRSRTAHSRQQTLRATLDWSYSLLNPPEQRLLEYVSAFAGGWTLEAAEAICSDGDTLPEQVLDLLTSLVDKSLVTFDGMGPMEVGRYRLLEMVRQYAGARLRESGQERMVQNKHRDWFLRMAEEANLSGIEAAELDRVLQRLEADHDNLQAALVWCERDVRGAHLSLRMAAALSRFWSVRNFYSEGRGFLLRALSRENVQGANAAQGAALTGAGILAARQADYVSARAHHDDSLVVFRELGDIKAVGKALDYLNDVAHLQGDTAAAQHYYQEARAHCEQSLRISREGGDKSQIARELNALAMLIHNQDRGGAASSQSDDARGFFEECLGIYQELGDKSRSAMQLNGLGVMSHIQGDYDTARKYYERSLILYRDTDAKSGIAMLLNSLGILAYNQGHYDTARTYYDECLGIFCELDDQWWIARSYRCLFLVSKKQENNILARAFQEQEILLRRTLGDKAGLAAGLEGIASIIQREHDFPGAVRLRGAAQSLRDSIGAPLLPAARKDYDQEVSEARMAMAEDEFAAAWEEGRVLTWEQALEYALQ